MFFKKSSGIVWLIVFLGNPGIKYEYTRHNAGFMAAAAFEKAHSVKINKLRFKALTGECEIGGNTVLLMKPQTFMNLSGEAVRQAADYYKIPPEHIIVLSDEIALPIGKIRVRSKGSAGGHNGLKNIIAMLGTDEFPRIRIGVGSPPNPEYEMPDWVLGSFKGQDAEDIEKSVKLAAEAAECYILEGCDKTMNKYN